MTEPSDLERRVRAIEDRIEIEDVIIRYANAVDFLDDDLLETCFTDDATASFAGVPAGPGGAAIVAFLVSLRNAPVIGSTHRFGNVVVTLEGDEADVQSRGGCVRSAGRAVAVADARHHLPRPFRTDRGWVAHRSPGPHALVGGSCGKRVAHADRSAARTRGDARCRLT